MTTIDLLESLSVGQRAALVDLIATTVASELEGWDGMAALTGTVRTAEKTAVHSTGMALMAAVTSR